MKKSILDQEFFNDFFKDYKGARAQSNKSSMGGCGGKRSVQNNHCSRDLKKTNRKVNFNLKDQGE